MGIRFFIGSDSVIKNMIKHLSVEPPCNDPGMRKVLHSPSWYVGGLPGIP